MRWRGPSGQFPGSARPRAHLAGAGARAPRRGRREGRHHGRVGLARPFWQARCERSLSPGSSCAGGRAPPGPPLPSRPQPGLSGPGRGLAASRPSLSHARGESRGRRQHPGSAAGPRGYARGLGSSASGGSRPPSLRKEEEPQQPQPRSPGRGVGGRRRGVESKWRPRWRSSSGGGGGGWSERPARRADQGPGRAAREAASCPSGPGPRRPPRFVRSR